MFNPDKVFEDEDLDNTIWQCEKKARMLKDGTEVFRTGYLNYYKITFWLKQLRDYRNQDIKRKSTDRVRTLDEMIEAL